MKKAKVVMVKKNAEVNPPVEDKVHNEVQDWLNNMRREDNGFVSEQEIENDNHFHRTGTFKMLLERILDLPDVDLDGDKNRLSQEVFDAYVNTGRFIYDVMDHMHEECTMMNELEDECDEEQHCCHECAHHDCECHNCECEDTEDCCECIGNVCHEYEDSDDTLIIEDLNTILTIIKNSEPTMSEDFTIDIKMDESNYLIIDKMMEKYGFIDCDSCSCDDLTKTSSEDNEFEDEVIEEIIIRRTMPKPHRRHHKIDITHTTK